MNLKDFNTLAEAQSHTVTTGTLIHRDSMNGWLGAAGIYKRMKEIAADDTHPYANTLEAFLDSVEYNFKQGTTTGDAHIALLDSLIATEPTIGTQLASIKPIIMARANIVSKPHEFATQHDFAKAKGTMVYAQVTPSKGWLKITTTADCEAHRPQIYATIQGVKRRVAGFDVVSVAGDYLAQVPAGYPTFEIDNAYGVVS